MNNNTYTNINGCLTKEGIVYFLQNNEDNAFQNTIEEHLKNCELCREAVFGYKKLNDPEKIETANSILKERFSSSQKNGAKIISNQFIVNIITAAAVIVIAVLIVRNFTTIDYKTETPVYAEDLALLSKKEISRPAPPERTTLRAEPTRKQNFETSKPIDNKTEKEKIELSEKQNIIANKLPTKRPNHNNLSNNTDTDKKLVDKSYTEFQITLPAEVDRRGYAYNDNNLITASYKNNVALSALPSFNGKGMEGFVEYVSKNINYPEAAMANMVTGVVEIQFAIDVDGQVKEIEIKKGINPILDREAYRLIKNSPKWIPGFVDGKPTKVYFRFPVSFKIK